MKHRLFAAVWAAASTLALAAPARAEWIEAKSTHFTLVGDVGEDMVRRRVDRLERFDAMMRTLVPGSTPTNLPIMLVPSTDDVKRLRGNGSDGVLAFFSPSPFGVFAVSPASVGSDFGIGAETVLFHEYVHHMLLGSVDEVMPRWMSEGMAELFMNSRLESDGGVTIGLGNESRGYSLNQVSRWTAERLFDSDKNPPKREEVGQIYSKGWLVLHYLLFSGKRPGEFGKFTAALRRGVPQMQAAREAFGDLGKLESDLEFYRRRKTLPAIRISAAQLKANTAVTVRRLRADEADIMPQRLQSMVGVDAKTAPSVLAKARPIGARYPDSAFVQRALAEMEFDTRNFEQAEAAIERALAAEPDNLNALTYKGFLLGNRARREGRADLWKQARAAILKANRLAPDSPLPFILFFDSFEASGVTPSKAAVDGLLRAIVLQPSYQGLRVKVGLHLIATGDPLRARTILEPVAYAPHSPSDTPLTKLIAEIEKGTRGEALLAKIKELKISSGNLFELSTALPEGKDKDKDKAPKS